MTAAFSAGSLAQHDVVTVERPMLLMEAARLMREQHVGCLVVVQRATAHGKVPVGVLTDRDIVMTVVAGELDPRMLRVADVIDERLVCVREADALSDVLNVMRRAGVRRVPVTDVHGHLVGILSLDDVLLALTVILQQVVETVQAELRSEPQRRP